MKSFIVETVTPVVVYLLVEAESELEAKEIAKAQVERDYDFKPQYMGNDRSYASVKETISRVIGFPAGDWESKNDEKFYC